jgi:hypothetical protein
MRFLTFEGFLGELEQAARKAKQRSNVATLVR